MKDEIKNPDEFVFEDVQMVHYEVMSDEHIWMSISLNDGKYFHLNIHGRNLRTYLTDETSE